MITLAGLGRLILTFDPEQLHVHFAALEWNAIALTSESRSMAGRENTGCLTGTRPASNRLNFDHH